MAPPLGATATTAASGGNREELLGQRPAGCERQRSRRWVPQPGLGERSETERARTLTEMYKRGDSIALTKDLLIAARRLSGDILALSVCFADTSPKGRGTGLPAGAKNRHLTVTVRLSVQFIMTHSQTHPLRPFAKHRWRWCRGPRGRRPSRRQGCPPPLSPSCP